MNWGRSGDYGRGDPINQERGSEIPTLGLELYPLPLSS
jgi:hypothetical protein